MNSRIYFALAIFVLSLVLSSLQYSTQVGALSGSQFKAGNIISDSLFYNNGAMTKTQIDSFLGAKVPVCDTNGSQPYAGTTRKLYAESRGYSTPFTCLKDFVQATPNKSANSYCGFYDGGTYTAARIIYEVGKSCGISQKAMLVLLQKEQSLVTDDWPWSIQYRSATGYGCPDTAACNSEYYGFFNQVYNAAKQFNRYKQHPSSYNFRANRTSNIQYNPNTACGTKSVSIQNHATAGLYNYTPYTPNQAALNNLYGTGNSCSAYGNRNFWRIYNDWFGSTLSFSPDQALSGDWNGNGETTIGVKRGSQYLLDNDNDGLADVTFTYGSPKNKPLVGDWDDNGTDTISLKIGNRYFINNHLAPGTDHIYMYGKSSDRPLAGDWDGNGTDTISLKIGNRYFINNHLAPGTDHIYMYGKSSDRPLAGDWDGNNRDTVALKIGKRYFINDNLHPGTDSIFTYGSNGSFPLSGDWNDNGTDTISLKIGNKYYINNQLAPGTDTTFSFID